MPVILTDNISTEIKSSIIAEQNKCDINFSSLHAMNVPVHTTHSRLTICVIRFGNAVVFYGWKCSNMVACYTDEDIRLLCQQSHWVCWRPVQRHFRSVFLQLPRVFFMLRMHAVDQYLLKKNCKFLSCFKQVHRDTFVWIYSTAHRICTEHCIIKKKHSSNLPLKYAHQLWIIQWRHTIYNKWRGNQPVNWVGLQHRHPNKKQLSIVGT